MKKDKIQKLIKKMLKLFHLKVSKKTENLFVQIFKFVIVGGTAFILDFVFLFVFKEVFKLPILVSNTLSFIISTIYNYIASVKWVFDIDENKDKKKTFITFIAFSVMGLLLNDLIMWIMTDIMKIHYLIDKIVATAIVMVFNFITRKLFLE